MKEVINVLLKMVFVIGAPIVLLVVIICYVLLTDFVDAGKPTYKQIALVSPGSNSKLYIKTSNWGLTGDSQLTILTTEVDSKFELDSTRQIIFKGLEPFRYKQINDTLILCVRKKVIVPKGFKSSWTIIQKELDNSQMTDLRRDYEYKGI